MVTDLRSQRSPEDHQLVWEEGPARRMTVSFPSSVCKLGERVSEMEMMASYADFLGKLSNVFLPSCFFSSVSDQYCYSLLNHRHQLHNDKQDQEH